MAKRYKMSPQLYDMDSSLRKLKTVFEDKLLLLTRGSVVGNVRERVMDINIDVLRRMAERLSIVSMCVNVRDAQITPFFYPAKQIGEPGFVISKKGKLDKRFKSNDKKADMLTEMIQQTGFQYVPDREDDFVDFGKMFLRETLIVDQVAVELQRNKRGQIGAFWLIDGGTIFRCTEDGYEDNPNLAFVQEIDGQIVAAYTKEELIFDYMYKRVDIMHRGYGYSLLQQAVDLITTLILGISYNRDIFTKEKIPKGFIALQGEADRETIEAVERYWYMAMSGAGAKFKIPIIPSGKEGVSIDFKTLNPSNRDMEYYKLMLFFLSLFAGVFGIDLAELGIKTDNTQQSLGENIEGRIKYSKDRGIGSFLSFFKGFMNKILRKIDEEYEMTFVGINPEDEEKKYGVAKKAIDSTRTTNEMREEDGLEPLEGEEYDMTANAALIQIRQQLMGAAEGGEEYGEEYEGEEETGEEKSEELPKETEGKEVEEETEKSQKELEEHLEKLVKAGYEIET